MRPGRDLVRGAGNIPEGIPEAMENLDIPKFRENGLHIVHCGGAAGLIFGDHWRVGERRDGVRPRLC